MQDGVKPAALDVNGRAVAIVDGMCSDAALLRVACTRLDGGARVVDCGIDARGGLEAGRRMAEACMGGLGRVEIAGVELGGVRYPAVHVRTDHPAVACMASQYAGWAVKVDDFFAMGSGPLRAVARVEKDLYDELGYAEEAGAAGVLVLEGRTPPDDAVAEHLAGKSGLAADRLSLLIAPTASHACGVQVCARVVETSLHKIHELGFDVRRVESAFGTAPLPPVAKNDLRAIGRTNDSVLYGGVVHLSVRAGDEELERLAPEVPSSASRDYGTPFHEIFERYDRDFYQIDPHLFSPAEVFLHSVESGRTFHAGAVDPVVLQRSLLG